MLSFWGYDNVVPFCSYQVHIFLFFYLHWIFFLSFSLQYRMTNAGRQKWRRWSVVVVCAPTSVDGLKIHSSIVTANIVQSPYIKHVMGLLQYQLDHGFVVNVKVKSVRHVYDVNCAHQKMVHSNVPIHKVGLMLYALFIYQKYVLVM